MIYKQLLLTILLVGATQSIYAADITKLKNSPAALKEEYATIKAYRNIAAVSVGGITSVMLGIADTVKEHPSLYRKVVLFSIFPAAMFTATAGFLHWRLKKLEKQHPDIDF